MKLTIQLSLAILALSFGVLADPAENENVDQQLQELRNRYKWIDYIFETYYQRIVLIY